MVDGIISEWTGKDGTGNSWMYIQYIHWGIYPEVRNEPIEDNTGTDE